MKKTIAVFLCMCMIVSVMGGCGSNKTTSGTSNNNTSSSTTLTPGEQAIAERKASGKNTKVVMSFFTWVGAPKGTDRIEGLINKITEDKLGIDVDLLVMDSSSFSQNVPLMCASGEKLDIFSAGGIGFTKAVNNGYLYDMNQNDLLKNYGQGILNSMDNVYINACSVGNGLYAVPPVKDMAMSAGYLCIGSQFLDGIGYDYNSKWSDSSKEVIKTNWDELDKIFAQLHTKYPDKSVLTATVNIAGGSTYDPVSGDWFGVLMDPAKSLELSDVYASKEYMDLCKRSYKYNQLGYLPADCLTTTLTMGAQVGAGTAMSMTAGGKPGYRTQVSAECSMDMVCFQLGEDIVRSSVPTSVCWGINQNCQDPVAAMQLLDICYTNKDISNLLCWGEEGKDYVVNDDGRINFPSGIDSKNSEWYHAVQWQMPNECISHVWHTDSPDLWDRITKFNENAIKSKALGFTWDNTGYATQYTALSNVSSEYSKSLSLGCVDPEVGIPEFEEKLKAAGLDEYIGAKRDALNAWAKEKGIS